MKLNRREFLQALASVGATIAIPGVLAAAAPSQVDEAWSALLKDPWYFDLTEYGTLVETDAVEPKIRRDVFEYIDTRPCDIEALISEVDGFDPLRSEFRTAADHLEILEIQLEQLTASDEDDDRQTGRDQQSDSLSALIASVTDPDGGWQAWVRHDGRGRTSW